MKKLYVFFDQLEDVVRGALARRPVAYSFIGGGALVLFWRGVWHLADWLSELAGISYLTSSLLSIAAAVVVLLATGLFVSEFVGEKIIMSGLQTERRLTRKTESEVAAGQLSLEVIDARLARIEAALDEFLASHR